MLNIMEKPGWILQNLKFYLRLTFYINRSLSLSINVTTDFKILGRKLFS